MTNMTKTQIRTLETKDLKAIVRSTNPASEMFKWELIWAKDELKRRGAKPSN